MASVYKRSWLGQDGRERVRWVAAYKDQDGRRHNKGFLTRKDARAFLVLTEGKIALARWDRCFEGVRACARGGDVGRRRSGL